MTNVDSTVLPAGRLAVARELRIAARLTSAVARVTGVDRGTIYGSGPAVKVMGGEGGLQCGQVSSLMMQCGQASSLMMQCSQASSLLMQCGQASSLVMQQGLMPLSRPAA